MGLSGVRTFNLARNEIINTALRKLGVLSSGEVASGTHLAEAQQALNVMIQDWQNEDIFLWTQSDDLQLLTADTLSYSLDANIIEISNVFFRHNGIDTVLTPLSREEYKALADKDLTGTPSRYYIDSQLANPVLYLWPVYQYSTKVATGTDANKYLCTVDHASSSDNKPITGADYTDFWELTTETATAWVTATDYYSGVIRYTKLLRLQDFTVAGDNPDFPSRWLKAIIYGLMADLAPENAIRGQELRELKLEAEFLRMKAKNSNSESGNLQISPDMR